MIAGESTDKLGELLRDFRGSDNELKMKCAQKL